jgi:hypothetical protein
MNKKQTVVLWICVLLISLILVGDGIDTHDTLEAAACPVILIGGAMLYQFRDRGTAQPLNKTERAATVLIALDLLP